MNSFRTQVQSWLPVAYDLRATTPNDPSSAQATTTDDTGGLDYEIRERTVELEREITDRKRAQESLLDSEQRFKDFAEAASVWFWELDEDLRFTYLSDRLLEIGGSKPKDLLGKT